MSGNTRATFSLKRKGSEPSSVLYMLSSFILTLLWDNRAYATRTSCRTRHSRGLRPRDAGRVSAKPSIWSRLVPIWLAACSAWTRSGARMDGHAGGAAEDGVTLLIVSGYRSIDYQARLIRKKINAGQSVSEILAVNAAPGHSEHHTGRGCRYRDPGIAAADRGIRGFRCLSLA